MRKNFGPKSYMYPMPVLILATYNEDGTANAMNAAWGGICDSDKVFVCISGTHKTTENILARGAFTVSFADADNAVAADYVGLVSGKKVPDKFARAGWHAEKSAFVDAPLIAELPMALECRLLSFDEESEILIGKIMNVCADERILGDNGKPDLSKFRPICYDSPNHDYVALGEKVANAFESGSKLK